MCADLTIPRRSFLALGGAAVLSCGGVGRARAVGAAERLTGSAFATGWQIDLPAGLSGGLRPAVEARLDAVDRGMSPWRADSEIALFNTARAGKVSLSPETLHVAAAALALAEASEGHFDPTVGPLVARWGFGPIEGDPETDWQSVAVLEGALTKLAPGFTLDLCGIAKGRALDLMAQAAQGAGVSDYLIDLGGELIARGRHPEGRAWRIGIEDPRPGTTDLAAVLELDGLAVATSGSRAQSYVLDGRRYSHIIAPERGQPVETRLASVSVVADTAMIADGWATALMAAGDAGPELARGKGISALFLFDDPDGLRAEATADMAAYVL